MSQVRPNSPRVQCFEEVLAKTGWGLYYNFLLGYTCFSALFNAMATVGLVITLPLAICDTLNSTVDLVALHICINFGRTFGATIICCISDFYGKKCMISKTLLMIFLSSFIIAFAHNTYALYLAVMILGSGLESCRIISNVYLMEILPLHQRGFYAVFPDIFWVIGYFITTISTYAINAMDATVIEHRSMDMRLTFWRMLFALCGGVTLLLACISALLENSPRFLLLKKRLITASLILKQFYAINKSKYSETVDIFSQDLYSLIDDFHLNVYPEPIRASQQVIQMMFVSLKMFSLLFSKRFIQLTLTIMFLKLPNMFGMVGLNILLAKNFQKEANSIIEGYDLLQTVVVTQSSQNCTTKLDQEITNNFLLLSLNIFIGFLFLLLAIDYIGRKLPMYLGLTLSCFAYFVLAYKKKENLIGMIMSGILTTSQVLIETTSTIVVMEAYPTAIRSLAVVHSQTLGYIIMAFFYLFYSSTTNNLFTMMAVLCLVASMLCHYLPEMKHRPMTE